MSVALLDADIIAYRSIAKTAVDWGEGEATTDWKAALRYAESMITDWRTKAGCDSHILCFSPKDGRNYRKELSEGYKAHRPDKPDGYWDLVGALEKHHKVYRIAGLEADDVMGILATGPHFKGAVIVSIDKDLLTIPARVLNPDKPGRPKLIRMLDATLTWLTQALTGDTTDGYKGCPGIGPKKAEALFEQAWSPEDAWELALQAFIDKGLTEADAITNARMARILHHSDYDAEQHRVRLWHPNKQKAEWYPLSPPSSASTPQPPAAEKPPSPTSSSTTTASGGSASRDSSSRRSAASSKGSASQPKRHTGGRKATSRKSRSSASEA